MKPTVVSLFSGIGGLDLAAHWAGFETVRFVEKEPFCQKVLAKHWPGVPIDDDVFTSHPGHADLVVGGFPCQPFSVAGKQDGEEDERYLLPEMLRIVREVQPYAVVFENVPGFPALNDGSSFKYLLGALAEMGFDAQWGHLRASDIGAPHQRERWFCVAYMVNPAQRLSTHLRKCTEELVQQAVDHGSGQWNDCEPLQWAQLAYAERRTGQSFGANCCQGRATDSFSAGCEVVEYPYGFGLQEFQPSASGSESGFAAGRSNPVMGNTAGIRCEGHQPQSRGNGLFEGRLQEPARRSEWQAQPGIRGVADGLPGRLDFAGFPARPGQPQFAYEPGRTAPGTSETNARLKALGNAVVPAVAYPIFKELMEWFKEREASNA